MPKKNNQEARDRIEDKLIAKIPLERKMSL